MGRIVGGGPVNIVPDFAICRINARYTKPEEFEQVSRKLEEIQQQINQKDPRLDLSLIFMYGRGSKSFGKNDQQLFDLLNEAAQEEGYTLSCRPSGGVSDGNLIAQTGIPVLDTLGAIGGEIHTENEYLLLDSLTSRARLTARFLMNAASKGIFHEQQS